MVRAVRHADADAEVQFPIRGEVQIDRRHDEVFLIASRVEMRHRPQGTVILPLKSSQLAQAFRGA